MYFHTEMFINVAYHEDEPMWTCARCICLHGWSRSFRNLEHCLLVQDAKILGTNQASRHSASSILSASCFWLKELAVTIGFDIRKGLHRLSNNRTSDLHVVVCPTFGSVLRCYAICHHLFLLCKYIQYLPKPCVRTSLERNVLWNAQCESHQLSKKKKDYGFLMLLFIP